MKQHAKFFTRQKYVLKENAKYLLLKVRYFTLNYKIFFNIFIVVEGDFIIFKNNNIRVNCSIHEIKNRLLTCLDEKCLSLPFICLFSSRWSFSFLSDLPNSIQRTLWRNCGTETSVLAEPLLTTVPIRFGPL